MHIVVRICVRDRFFSYLWVCPCCRSWWMSADDRGGSRGIHIRPSGALTGPDSLADGRNGPAFDGY